MSGCGVKMIRACCSVVFMENKTPPGKERRLRLIRAGYLPGFFGGLAGFSRSPVAFSTTDKAFCEKSLRMRGFFFTRPIYHLQAALEAG